MYTQSDDEPVAAIDTDKVWTLSEIFSSVAGKLFLKVSNDEEDYCRGFRLIVATTEGAQDIYRPTNDAAATLTLEDILGDKINTTFHEVDPFLASNIAAIRIYQRTQNGPVFFDSIDA